MKIGINGQNLLDQNPAGPEKYTHSIINALAKVDTCNKYVIYFTGVPPADYFARLTNNNANFEFRAVTKQLSWTHVSLAMQLAKDKPDIYFTPVHTMPLVRPGTLKTVGMIHGLEYTYSKEYGSLLKKFLVDKPVRFVATHSDALIVPSEYTKAALLSKPWHINEAKITVVPEGVDATFYKRPDSEVLAIRKKYKLGTQPYLIFVSTIQPRKNLPGLIEGFSRALSELDQAIKLVVVGKKGWLVEESLEAPKKFGIGGRILFLGRVPDVDLPVLLSGAAVFVNTSFEEGFGLPLLEAMACETPCMVSDIPSFRAVGGNLVGYVNPYDVADIAGGIVATFRNINSEVLSEAIAKAKLRSLEFSWEKSAQQTLQVFQQFA